MQAPPETGPKRGRRKRAADELSKKKQASNADFELVFELNEPEPAPKAARTVEAPVDLNLFSQVRSDDEPPAQAPVSEDLLQLLYDPHWMDNNRRVEKQQSEILNSSVTTIIKLLHDFVGEDWPMSTSICCWHCSHTFNTPPLKMPTHYDERKTPKYRDSFGIFCSWSCMYTYNLDIKGGNAFTRSTAIHMLRSAIDGTGLKPIKRAPPKQALKMFGGHLDIVDFRAKLDNLVPNERASPEGETICSKLAKMCHIEYDRLLVCRGDGTSLYDENQGQQHCLTAGSSLTASLMPCPK